MGGALARAVAKTSPEKIVLCDKDAEKCALLAGEIGAEVGNINDLSGTDFVFLGVKPNMIREVAGELSRVIGKSTTVISMAAGVSIEAVETALGGAHPVIRIMPNTPVAYGKGMILFSVSETVSEARVSEFVAIMKHAGRLDSIPERLIDAGSAVSGCGPAFVYMFIEALADGGVAAGLPRDKALAYAAETAIGAATVLLKSGKHPGELKDAVCSPGGSTIEGVLTLESGGMRGIVSDAVIAAYEKTKKLGK